MGLMLTSIVVAVTAWPQSSPLRENAGTARRTGFGAGLRRGVAVVLAVAALACWFGKPSAIPVAPSTAASPIAARVAVGAALIEQSPTARPVRSEPVTGPSGAAYYARAIETIQTGQRVLACNPELAGVELPDAAVDPATRVNIRLRMQRAVPVAVSVDREEFDLVMQNRVQATVRAVSRLSRIGRGSECERLM